jgi:hypothetical protein
MTAQHFLNNFFYIFLGCGGEVEATGGFVRAIMGCDLDINRIPPTAENQ